MPEKKQPAWALADGSPKPEWELKLRAPLSDDTRSLMLHEPPIKALRRATSMLVMDAVGNPTPESGIAFGIALISSTVNMPESIIEELPKTQFQAAVDYLSSFE